MLKLTHENYFSGEAEAEYMSYSQFKKFEICEEAAMFGIVEDKACYTEGHFFEALLEGNGMDFIEDHPEMLTKQGELRANYKQIGESALAIRKQPVLTDIIDRCEKQVILTGEIAGVPFKGCIDLLDPVTLDSYDTKCVKDFRRTWSDADNQKLEWYFAYGYHYQALIYRELIYQNFGKAGAQHLIAATKEKVPDVEFWKFSTEILDDALSIINYAAPRYHDIKKGKEKPCGCGECDYCKANKIIHEPYTIKEFM